jgi:hypothetical protein
MELDIEISGVNGAWTATGDGGTVYRGDITNAAAHHANRCGGLRTGANDPVGRVIEVLDWVRLTGNDDGGAVHITATCGRCGSAFA